MLLHDLATLHTDITEVKNMIDDILNYTVFAGATGYRKRELEHARSLLQDAQKIVERYLEFKSAEVEKELRDADAE